MGIINSGAVSAGASSGDILISTGCGSATTVTSPLAMATGTTIGSSGYWLTVDSGTGMLSWNYNSYGEDRKIYGDELVDKFIKMKEMSVEEFAKSEFYRDLLKDT